MADGLRHCKHLELTEFKHPDVHQIIFHDNRKEESIRSSSSESLEMCYEAHGANKSLHNKIYSTSYDSLSSNEYDDEDSKMMELPQTPRRTDCITKKFISSLSPNSYSHKIKYSPIRTPSKYNQFKLVTSLDKCLLNQTSKRILSSNCTHSYWRRMFSYFCLALFVSIMIAFVLLIFIDPMPITLRYSSIFIICVPFIAFGLIFFRHCFLYNWLNNHRYDETKSIQHSQYFKDPQITNTLIQNMNENQHFKLDPDLHMIYNTNAGFSAFAALNTILSSIYDNGLFIQFPMKQMHMELKHICHLIKDNILDNYDVDIKRFPNIKLKLDLMKNEQMTLGKFKDWIQSTTARNKYIRTYFIAQFNKQPLFHCETSHFQKVTKWISSHGYFSPIVGCHIDQDQNIHALVLDVDKNYGYYLVPIERLFQAVTYCDHQGKCGGLLKLEAHFIL